jgi:hypothetical protein
MALIMILGIISGVVAFLVIGGYYIQSIHEKVLLMKVSPGRKYEIT